MNYHGKFYTLDVGDISPYSYENIERALKTINDLAIKETGKGIDLCVVDHINLFKFGDPKLDTTDATNKYTLFFREQAANWCGTKNQVAMLIISQASRECEKCWEKTESSRSKYEKLPRGNYLLSHFAEGNELERSSSVVLTVYVDEGLKVCHTAQVGLIKNRDGNTIEYAFETPQEADYYKFGNKVSEINSNNTSSIPKLKEVIQVEGLDFSEFGI